jgi:hypothetical protein
MLRSNSTTSQSDTARPAHKGGPRRQPDPDLLAPHEREALVRALRRSSAAAPTPSLNQTVEWARSVRLHALLLDCVLSGDVDILLSDDGSEMLFKEHTNRPIVPLAAYRRQ